MLSGPTATPPGLPHDAWGGPHGPCDSVTSDTSSSNALRCMERGGVLLFSQQAKSRSRLANCGLDGKTENLITGFVNFSALSPWGASCPVLSCGSQPLSPRVLMSPGWGVGVLPGPLHLLP